MIKNFLDADEDDSLITRRSPGEKPIDENEFQEFVAPFSKIEDDADLLEIPESKNDAPDASANREHAAEPNNLDALIEPPPADSAAQTATFQPSPETIFSESSAAKTSEDTKKEYDNNAAPMLQSQYQSESSDETIRKSGLAYSAAIILFGSIVFTLILGWFADLLFGTAPWGKVGGIVLGAVIGFIQFFRTTSQILKDED